MKLYVNKHFILLTSADLSNLSWSHFNFNLYSHGV